MRPYDLRTLLLLTLNMSVSFWGHSVHLSHIGAWLKKRLIQGEMDELWGLECVCSIHNFDIEYGKGILGSLGALF